MIRTGQRAKGRSGSAGASLPQAGKPVTFRRLKQDARSRVDAQGHFAHQKQRKASCSGEPERRGGREGATFGASDGGDAKTVCSQRHLRQRAAHGVLRVMCHTPYPKLTSCVALRAGEASCCG